MTIWQALTEKLGREPTHQEAKAEVQRILKEGWEEIMTTDTARKPYRTELTPAGEQSVIPGCERDASPTARQLDLF